MQEWLLFLGVDIGEMVRFVDGITYM